MACRQRACRAAGTRGGGTRPRGPQAFGGPEHLPLAWLAERVARALGQRQPAVWARHEDAFLQAGRACAGDVSIVERALLDTMRSRVAADAYDDAFDAAHALVGLDTQRRLHAPASDAAATASAPWFVEAAKTLEACRRALAPKTLYRIKDLVQPRTALRAAWRAKHHRPSRPAVALSAKDMYRLESTCGPDALLRATRHVEAHHACLAAWFGKDPFVGSQGRIRLHSTYAEHEAEGTPFWWAPGFQRGDLTVALVRWTSDMRLAELLVHELTHRFQGALLPNLPTWLSEGQAVYTQTCLRRPHDTVLDERRVSLPRIIKASNSGYTRIHQFRKLIQGEPDDARDNYAAGYALYLYLSRFGARDDGTLAPPWFRERLATYLRSFASGPPEDPIEHFVSAFADGKGHRPAGLAAFVAGWHEFAQAFMRPTKLQPAWTRKWSPCRQPRAAVDACTSTSRTTPRGPRTWIGWTPFRPVKGKRPGVRGSWRRRDCTMQPLMPTRSPWRSTSRSLRAGT